MEIVMKDFISFEWDENKYRETRDRLSESGKSSVDAPSGKEI